MHDPDPAVADADDIAQRVREEIARRRISRQALADMARISLSTLEKALTGARPFTLATTIRIEEALGVPLRRAAKADAVASSVAPAHMGAYARSAVGWIEGRYLTLRPSFGTLGGIFAYVTTIRWIEDKGYLGFAESERSDARFEQTGHVALPHLSGHVYLATNEQGQNRLAILSRPSVDDTMFGILATLEIGHGSQLVPAATTIVLRKADRIDGDGLGRIGPASPHYAGYRELLSIGVEDDFVRFHTL
jgi:transcriptional regulator with XRE-family HTH domain